MLLVKIIKKLKNETMNKRGISQVVTTVLLILVVLAAVSIIWAFVRPAIEKTAGGISISSITIDLEIVRESVFDNTNTSIISFDVKRKSGEGKVVGLKVILEDTNGEEKLFDFPLVINQLETKGVSIDYSTSTLGNIAKISIAAVFEQNEQEAVGNVVDVLSLKRMKQRE